MASYVFTVFYGDTYLDFETSIQDTLLELYTDVARILRIDVLEDVLCLMHEGVALGTTVDELQCQLRALGRFSTGKANLFLIRRIRDHDGYSNGELRVHALLKHTVRNHRSEMVARAFMNALGSQFAVHIQQQEDVAEDVAVTLDEEQLSRVLVVGAEREPSDPCAICSDTVATDDLAVISQCNHGYHRECITVWLTQHSVCCPLCTRDTREGLQ